MKNIKRYSTINKPELIKILWNSAVFIDKTNLKRIKTVNSKRATNTIMPVPVPVPAPEPIAEPAPETIAEPAPEPASEPIAVPAPETTQLEPETKKRKYISHALRRLVWNKYINEKIGEHACLCCESIMISQLNFECGHVVSAFNGGSLEIENLRPICTPCNRSMNFRNMIDFMKDQSMPGLKHLL